jgi:hypothetical protein
MHAPDARAVTPVVRYGVMSSWGGSIRLLASLAVTGLANMMPSDVSLGASVRSCAPADAGVYGAEVCGAGDTAAAGIVEPDPPGADTAAGLVNLPAVNAV